MPSTLVTYNVDLMVSDMTAKGWAATDLARRAKVADITVSRFFRCKQQSIGTARKLARALKRPVSRYVASSRAKAVA